MSVAISTPKNFQDILPSLLAYARSATADGQEFGEEWVLAISLLGPPSAVHGDEQLSTTRRPTALDSGIPERSADDYRLAFARSLHHDAGGPHFGILALEPCISPHTNLGGQRSERLGLERRRAIEFHEPVWR